MRLECPKCAAQYEVDDALIPPEGRDVQCSACGHTWFYRPEDASGPPAAQAAAEPEPAAARPPRRELDPRVAEILRDEAARDSSARQRGPQPAAPQGPDRPAPRPRADPRPEAKLRSPAAIAAASRGDLPPDAESIGSTLGTRRDAPEADPGRSAAPRRSRGGDGFRLGFGLVVIVTAALILLYAFAPGIAERLPSLEPTLARYVDDVNVFRATLDAWIGDAIDQLRALIGQSG